MCMLRLLHISKNLVLNSGESIIRDGTDYGEVEVSLETKISQVLGQSKSGKAVIVYDQGTEPVLF